VHTSRGDRRAAQGIDENRRRRLHGVIPAGSIFFADLLPGMAAGAGARRTERSHSGRA